MGSPNDGRPRFLATCFILVAAIVLAYRYPDTAHRIPGQARDLLAKVWPGAGESSPEPGAEAPPAGQAPARGINASGEGTLQQTEATVESYMQKHAARNCAVSVLGWSDFAAAGPRSIITLRYRIQQPGRTDAEATVRFTVQGGEVAKTELVQPPGAPLPAVVSPFPRALPRPVVVDRFSGPLFAASHGGSMTLRLDSAFSLAQLEQAKEKARAERKPLGFLMVWGQFFGHEADPRDKGSDSALVHFYEAFHQNLVLVFVRHETELGQVPEAVKKGFFGPNEGGFAPNMAVVDATATEFITEIPFRGLDGNGRDPLFAAGGREIDQWLATHPAAMATPASAN